MDALGADSFAQVETSHQHKTALHAGTTLNLTANGASRRREHNGIRRGKRKRSMDEPDALIGSLPVMQ